MSVTISMPQLGETVTEGTILAWVKEIGDYVAEDDILVEISTDKVDTEIPSPAHGVLTEILVAAGTTIDVGTPIAILTEADEAPDGEQPSAISSQPSVEEEPSAQDEPSAASSQPSVAEAPQAGNRERRGILSPVVRKLAGEHNVDLAMVPGTGDGGRITRKDVESFIEGQRSDIRSQPAIAAKAESEIRRPVATPVAVAGEVREIPRLRSLIAENMVAAKQSAAHVWTSVEVDYERVVRVRLAHKEAFKEAEGFSLTYLPFIARATMEALAAFPVVNSELNLEAGTHTFHKQVDLGLAIDLNQRA